jgi:hypothetical protein
VTYRDQIPTFNAVADKLGLRDISMRDKPVNAEKDAIADARADARGESAPRRS